MMSGITVAPSLNSVTPSKIRELADHAFGMDGVLKLHFGESNLSTADYIKQAATEAMADGHTFYTENGGIPELRESIANKYCESRGWHPYLSFVRQSWPTGQPRDQPGHQPQENNHV